jgi:hypothetical protein
LNDPSFLSKMMIFHGLDSYKVVDLNGGDTKAMAQRQVSSIMQMFIVDSFLMSFLESGIRSLWVSDSPPD